MRAWVWLAVLAACKGEDGEGKDRPDDGTTPTPTTPPATVTTDVPIEGDHAKDAAAFALFDGRRATFQTLFENGTTAPDGVVADIALDPAGPTLTLALSDRDGNSLGDPLVLGEVSPGVFGGPADGALGVTGQIRAFMELDGPGGEELNLAILPVGFGLPEDTDRALSQVAERRTIFYNEYYERRANNECNDLTRFANVVQRIFEYHANAIPPENDLAKQVVLQLALSDMVDMFILSESTRDLMLGPFAKPTLTATIPDPDPTCEPSSRGFGKTGFGEVLREGEGRFRHFVSNAYTRQMIRAQPVGGDVYTWLFAGWWGGDLIADNQDEVNDRTTNGLGIEFANFVDDLDEEQFTDGTSIRNEVIRLFNQGSPLALHDGEAVTLSSALGEYGVGEVIGLCRIRTRDCTIEAPTGFCDSPHLVEPPQISIDDAGPFADPYDYQYCGYGRVSALP